MDNLQKNILNKIKAGEISMVPKWHFVLRGVLWATMTIVVALIAIYLLSFVMFALRESGLMFAPLFGWSGLVLFIVSSPWIIILASGFFLLALYVLVSHYSFSYQKPLVYSMVGLVFLVIALSSFIQTTGFHNQAGDFANRHGVPGLAPLYRGVGERPPQDVTKGTISELTDSQFTLIADSGEVYTVELNNRTKLPKQAELIEGESVFVFGHLEETTIKAFGVRINNGQQPRLPEERGEGGGERQSRPALDGSSYKMRTVE
ncbi:hypothetical protein KC730_00980 [Candidatus Kaiserbacteria bacterium]|nr:hypothetical protein [Candidatus Kaiserbacteria bacterium]